MTSLGMLELTVLRLELGLQILLTFSHQSSILTYQTYSEVASEGPEEVAVHDREVHNVETMWF
jgi:hypothetical protein